MSDFYILGHLGLGDHLLCNGLVRVYASERKSIKIPCYKHNLESVAFMFSDLPNVEVIGIKDEADAVLMCHKKECLRLGYYSEDTFQEKYFDQEFYRHAKISFGHRWDSFKIPGYPFPPHPIDENGCFMHEDDERGFFIKRAFLRTMTPYLPNKVGSTNIFSHLKVIDRCIEVHCINSSFLILIDSLPTIEGQNLYFHHYPRPTPHPMLRKRWQIF